MSDADKSALGATRSASGDEEAPDVPGFRTWRGVYAFVFGCFVLSVVALAIFARVLA